MPSQDMHHPIDSCDSDPVREHREPSGPRSVDKFDRGRAKAKSVPVDVDPTTFRWRLAAGFLFNSFVIRSCDR